MSEHEDCRFWGLTWGQCGRYHARLARHYAACAAESAERAQSMGALALRWALVAYAFGVLALVIHIFA